MYVTKEIETYMYVYMYKLLETLKNFCLNKSEFFSLTMHAHMSYTYMFILQDGFNIFFECWNFTYCTCKHILLTIDADCDLSVLHSSKMQFVPAQTPF